MRSAESRAAEYGEIERLKKQARALHARMQAGLGEADCGHSLLSVIRPAHGEMVREFDGIIARLRAIDPAFPKGG